MSSTERDTAATTAPQAVREARDAQQMTLRAFGEALGVTHQAVAMWESGEREIDTDRLKTWLNDERVWVRVLGVRVFSVKFGPMLASAAGDPPKAA